MLSDDSHTKERPGGLPAQTRRMDLPARLDLGATGELAEAFAHLRGTPLVMNAAAVQHAGTLCLQLLLSARMQWHLDGQEFGIEAPSEAFRSSLRILGLDSALMGDRA